MQGQITDPKAALAFILAGDATVTFRSLTSGNRYTFRITEAEKRNPNDAPLRFVKLLNGPLTTPATTFTSASFVTVNFLGLPSRASAKTPPRSSASPMS